MGGFRKAAIVLSIALLVVYCAVFFQLRDQLSGGYSDFVSFYTAGTILERGSRTRLYDIQLQSAIQREIAPNVEIRQLALPFVRPAFEAWLFWPFASFLPIRLCSMELAELRLPDLGCPVATQRGHATSTDFSLCHRGVEPGLLSSVSYPLTGTRLNTHSSGIRTCLQSISPESRLGWGNDARSWHL